MGKLNKGEKRALKFAMKKGVDIEHVGEMKAFLGEEIRKSKITHNTPMAARGSAIVKHKKPVAIKSNTYKDLEDYTSD